MTFWDSSALLAMVLGQKTSEELVRLAVSDEITAVWWGTKVEGMSALSRARRDRAVDEATASHLWRQLESLTSAAQEVEPTEEVRDLACRLLRVHELRAGDALQLAAALTWGGHRPAGVGFACLDRRLRLAAEWEGFEVRPR